MSVFPRVCGVVAVLALSTFSSVLRAADEGVEQITALTEKKSTPVTLKGNESIATRASFKPPVDITFVVKTDSTNIRIGYAAKEVIFNWEDGPTELRVDGGPANGKHKAGAGGVPTNRYLNIRWVVTPQKQSIFVDDQLRYEHEGDYSKIDNPITVRAAHGSKVTVKSIKVKAPAPAAK